MDNDDGEEAAIPKRWAHAVSAARRALARDAALRADGLKGPVLAVRSGPQAAGFKHGGKKPKRRRRLKQWKKPEG